MIIARNHLKLSFNLKKNFFFTMKFYEQKQIFVFGIIIFNNKNYQQKLLPINIESYKSYTCVKNKKKFFNVLIFQLIKFM